MPTEIWSSWLMRRNLAAGKKCFSMLLLGNTGASFQDVPRKLAKADFRHMDAAKGTLYTAKGSRKKWRKGRQNRTQIIGVLATAQFVFRIGVLENRAWTVVEIASLGIFPFSNKPMSPVENNCFFILVTHVGPRALLHLSCDAVACRGAAWHRQH